MNISSNNELIATSILGALVVGALAFNGMVSAVAVGTMIAASVVAVTYAFKQKSNQKLIK
jgi:uncharacterized membrane protein HdeD (DUF308 family)